VRNEPRIAQRFSIMKRVALALVLVACSKPSSPSTSGATPPTPPSLAPSASPPDARTTTATPTTTCDWKWGFKGTVAGQPAFLRLVQRDGAISGRYFYEKIGQDIALHGTIAGSSDVELTEGDPNKSTGRFKGSCEPGGAFTGTWSNDKGAQPFRFEPVPARDTPIVASKKMHVARKVKHVGSFGMKECTYDETAFELFGARTPEAETAINGRDANDVSPHVLSKDTYGDVTACESGVTAEFGRTVTKTWNDLVDVQQVGTFNYDGAAHPGNAVDYSHVTFDLRTGKAIGQKDVLAKIPTSLVESCKQWYAKAHASEWDGIDIDADGSTFVLVPDGIQIFGTSYGHAAAVLTGRGPVLTWGALLRENALRADSPVKRAWEGKGPNGAADAKKDCEKDE
jgi:hypothetical protein